MFKCVAKADHAVDGRVLCRSDADQLFQGSTLCETHLVDAVERAEDAGSFGGMLKSFEKITLDDVAKISAVMRPLMDVFSAGMGTGMTATPAICSVTEGCLRLAGHPAPCESQRGDIGP